MGRKAEPKCLYCARNYATEEEALAKHPDCYVAKIGRFELENDLDSFSSGYLYPLRQS